MSPDVTSLLTAVGTGDRGAFAHLYDTMATEMYDAVVGGVSDHDEAGAIAEQALIEVWRWSPRFDADRMDASKWIMAIAAEAAGEPLRPRADDEVADAPPPTLRQAVLERLDEVRQVAKPLPPGQFIARTWAVVAAIVLLVSGGATVLRQLEDPFTAVATASDAKVVDIHVDDGASGEIAFSPGMGRIAIRFADFPDPAPGGTYQLWLLDEAGASIPSILFAPDETGSVLEAVETRIHALSGVVVSREPAGGSGTPGDDIVLIAPFGGLGEDEDHA